MDQDKAKVIREVFKLARKGWGIALIAKHLNERNVRTFGDAKQWGKSYIIKLLRNRQLIGEYQPTKVTWVEVKDEG